MGYAPFDVLIGNVVMDEVSGIDAAVEICKVPPNCKVLLVQGTTGLATNESSGCLTKLYDLCHTTRVTVGASFPTMARFPRHRYIQTLSAKLLLNDFEHGALRRELAWPLTPIERRNAIRERISTLFRERKRTKSKLEWIQAEERLRCGGHNHIPANSVRSPLIHIISIKDRGIPTTRDLSQ